MRVRRSNRFINIVMNTTPMATVWTYTLASVALVSIVSLIGVITLAITAARIKKVLLYLISFSAGALFGDVFFHLLPEAVDEAGDFTVRLSLYVLSGIVLLFVVEKIIRWRHCHVHMDAPHHRPFAWMNLIGDGIHNFIDGLIIGASYLASIPIGIATTLAVVLHEIPQELGDFGVLLHGGFSRAKALFFNFMTALTAVLGAVVALFLSTTTEHLTNFMIPFAAGSFIYIAGSDLIPELHKDAESQESMLQLGAFLLGIAVMATLLLIE